MSYYFKKGERGKGRKERVYEVILTDRRPNKTYLTQSRMKFKLNIFLSEENMDQSQDFLVLGFI